MIIIRPNPVLFINNTDICLYIVYYIVVGVDILGIHSLS